MSDTSDSAPGTKGTAGSDSVKSVAELVEVIISQPARFLAFCGLVTLLMGLSLLIVWLVPIILHVSTSKLTISSKGSEIELKSSAADQDQYYLVVSPQASWQPTHIYVKRGSKLEIVADGRVNIDLHGLSDQIEKRIALEKNIESKHPGLRTDKTHTPEEYFSQQEWATLAPRHYWSGPDGDFVVTPTSFAGRQRYKIAPDLAYGALLGTIMTREDYDSSGQPPNEHGDVLLIGHRWPDPKKEDTVPATGWLWLAINDVVEPESAFPDAKGIRLSDLFLLDNLGSYRVVVTVLH